MGWLKDKVKSVAKTVQTGARKVMTPVRAVERVVRPIGKKIPVVGYFAQLHEDIGEPIERTVLGIKGEKKTKIERTMSQIIEPAARLADNSTFKSVNAAYGGSIPAPYKSYTMAVSSDPTIVGATLSEATLLESGKGLKLNGKTLLPGSPGFAAVTKVGTDAQLKTMRDWIALAQKGDAAAKKSLSVLQAANPTLYNRLAGAANSKVYESVHTKTMQLLSPTAQKVVSASLSNNAATATKMRAALDARAKAGEAGARAAVTVVNALQTAKMGDPSVAVALLQANQKRASEVRAGGALREPPSTFYKVTTPEGRVITIPQAQVKR